jgi:heme/copper-type cytochrome/quinol oxidase subunit 2
MLLCIFLTIVIIFNIVLFIVLYFAIFARKFPELPESVPRDRIPIFKHQTNKELYYQLMIQM